MKNVKEWIFDFRLWILVILTFVGIGLGISGWAGHPERIKATEETNEKQDEKILENKGEIKEYIAVNEGWKKEQMRYQDLMMKYIDKKEKENVE